jgi:uncharacterized protein (TIGR02996 family)
MSPIAAQALDNPADDTARLAFADKVRESDAKRPGKKKR